MDYKKFREQLPEQYENWGELSVKPKSEKFQGLCDRVRGMTTVNVMQLLNWAVSCREADEIYCEVGCLQGASTIGALLDNPECMAYAVDNFSEFDPFGENAEKLRENILKYGMEEQVFVCESDVEEFFCELQELNTEDKIGVYFYDGAQDYRSQLMGLLWAKKSLSERAIIIVTSRNFAAAKQGTMDFIAGHGECEILLDFSDGVDEEEFRSSWNGVLVLSWDVERNQQYNWSFWQEKRNQGIVQEIEKIQAKEREEKIDNWHREALRSHASREYASAERKYQDVLLLQRDNADAWRNWGMLYYMQERYQEALEKVQKALQIDGSKADQYYSLGLVLEKMENVSQAIQAYQEVVKIDNKKIEAYNNLGNLLVLVGDREGAESVYRQAIAANPEHFGGYINLGNVLFAKDKIDEAIEAYKQALELNPENKAGIYMNIGRAYEKKKDEVNATQGYAYADYNQGKYKEAIPKFEFVLKNAKSEKKLRVIKELADCYKNNNEYEKAIAMLKETLNSYPEEVTFYFSLMSILKHAGRVKEAVAVGREGLQRFPENLFLEYNKQRILPIIYEYEAEIEEYRREFSKGVEEFIKKISLETKEEREQALKEIGRETNFYLQYQGKDDLELQIKDGNLVHKIVAANYPQWVKPLSMPPLSKEGKIRVGYISACMYGHTVGKLMQGWFRKNDRSQIEVYGYYIGKEVDVITNKFQLDSDRFYQIREDEAVCEQIISDRLHILVFVEIGMNPHMTKLGGLRLAPIQCATWGHPITTGLPTIDYFLSSDLMEPPNGEEHYSEKLIRLPNLGICYPKPNIPEPTETRADFQLRSEAIVYLSCQSLYKYLPQYDYIFAAIAQQVPEAQFAFLESASGVHITEQFQKRLARAFAKVGLNSENYCVFVPRLSQNSYFNLNQVSDIFLDTLSWSGGNTTLEAIACNLPVVTCPGEFMRGRHSYGILKMLGVTDTIAPTPSKYIEIAVRLGRDRQWRDSIVQRIKERHRYLYDDTDCIAALSEFYQRAVAAEMAKTVR